MPPRNVKLRYTSTSSIESLPSYETIHPFADFPDFSWLPEVLNTQVSYVTCPLTHFMMAGDKGNFKILIRIGQRLRRKRYLEYREYFETISRAYDVPNSRVYEQPLLVDLNGPNEIHHVFLQFDNGGDWRGQNPQGPRNAIDTITWYSKFHGYKYGTRAQNSCNEVLSFLTTLVHEPIESRRDDMIYCYSVYWEAISLPYVRIQQMNNMFQTEWRMRCPDRFRIRIESMLRTYINIFPNLAIGDIQPRSLKHLCRCQIRNVLWRNRNKMKPEILNFSTLNLPKSLIKYFKIIE